MMITMPLISWKLVQMNVILFTIWGFITILRQLNKK